MKFKNFNIFEKNTKYLTTKLVLAIISTILMLFTVATSSSVLAMERVDVLDEYSVVKLDLSRIKTGTSNIFIKVMTISDDGFQDIYFESFENGGQSLFVSVPKNKKILITLLGQRADVSDLYLGSVNIVKRYPLPDENIKDEGFILGYMDQVDLVPKSEHSVDIENFNTGLNRYSVATIEISSVVEDYYYIRYVRTGGFTNPLEQVLQDGERVNFFDYKFLNEINK